MLDQLKVLASAAALVGTTAFAAAAQDAPLPLHVGYDGFSMTTIPMQFAAEKGYFEEEGVDVELTFVAGGSTLTQALIGGNVDLAQNGYSSAIAAAVAGADIKIVGGIANILPFVIVGRPEVKTFEDLKGKTIAVSRFGSSTHASAKMAMEHFGMAEGDVTVLQLGGEADRTAAFMTDQVAANVLQYPVAQDLIDDGANLLVDMVDIVDAYPNTAYVTTESFLAEPDSQEAIKRYFRALARGMKGMRDNPAEAAQIAATFLKVEQTPNFDKAVSYYSEDVYARDLQPTIAGMQEVLDELAKEIPAAADASPEAMVDSSILDALNDEGFFETVKN